MRKQKRNREKIRVIIGLLATAVFLFSGYKVCNYFYEARQSSTVTDDLIAKAVETMQDHQPESNTACSPVAESAPITVDFSILQAENEDIVAWIYCEDTDECRFVNVPRYAPEKVVPDCVCDPAQPKLRCARFTKDGMEHWFLVNEGNEPIHTSLTLPTQLKIGAYDLWNATTVQRPSTPTENGVTIDFSLPVRGSILLFACTAAEYIQLPAPHAAYALPCPMFELADADPATAKKFYRSHITISAADLSRPSVTLTTHAEEMAELTVNSQSAGVGFWSPQTFTLDGLLHEGDNELTLTVTGNMANLHGKHPVWYGLAQDIR